MRKKALIGCEGGVHSCVDVCVRTLGSAIGTVPSGTTNFATADDYTYKYVGVTYRCLRNDVVPFGYAPRLKCTDFVGTRHGLSTSEFRRLIFF